MEGTNAIDSSSPPLLEDTSKDTWSSDTDPLLDTEKGFIDADDAWDQLMHTSKKSVTLDVDDLWRSKPNFLQADGTRRTDEDVSVPRGFAKAFSGLKDETFNRVDVKAGPLSWPDHGTMMTGKDGKGGEVEAEESSRGPDKGLILAIVLAVVGIAVVLLGLCIGYYAYKRYRNRSVFTDKDLTMGLTITPRKSTKKYFSFLHPNREGEDSVDARGLLEPSVKNSQEPSMEQTFKERASLNRRSGMRRPAPLISFAKGKEGDGGWATIDIERGREEGSWSSISEGRRGERSRSREVELVQEIVAGRDRARGKEAKVDNR